MYTVFDPKLVALEVGGWVAAQLLDPRPRSGTCDCSYIIPVLIYVDYYTSYEYKRIIVAEF